MKIKALVVDDELMSRKRIKRFLKSARDIEVVAEASHGIEALEGIYAHRPDLVFLDVQMPELDGFQVLEQLQKDLVPIIIFVTAHDEFALRAFEAHALDYLLKPFSEQRFNEALMRARTYLQGRDTAHFSQKFTGLIEEIQCRSHSSQRLAVKTGTKTVVLQLDELDWVEADGDYIRLHLGKESHLVRGRMNEFEKKFDPARFFRIHRSTIVNLGKVREFQPLFQGESIVILKNGTRLTVSRNCSQKLQDLLGKAL